MWWDSWVCAVQGLSLHSIFLVGSFQLRIVYDLVIRNNVFTENAVQPLLRLPRSVVESSPLEGILKLCGYSTWGQGFLVSWAVLGKLPTRMTDSTAGWESSFPWCSHHVSR